MRRLRIASRAGSYEVVAETGALSRIGEVLDAEGVARPQSVVSNATVGPLWGRHVAEVLGGLLVEIADGEEHKRWSTAEVLVTSWLDAGLHRRDSVLAVGGGVVTDIVGFAAAVYLRGISWTAAPTTLLAMIDAAVGGKTGVNLDQGKNLVGAFWPPRLVLVDVETLSTLAERELRAGAAEAVKTAWIGDHALLEDFDGQLLTSFDAMSVARWEELVMRCLKVKSDVVGTDEYETGRRAVLNLGHTLGHALEAATGYGRYLHGEAVAWGLLAAAELGHRHRLLSSDARDELTRAVAALGPMPPVGDIDPASLRPHIDRDKKRDAGGVAWVLPTDDGVALDQRIDTDEALDVFQELQRGS